MSRRYRGIELFPVDSRMIDHISPFSMKQELNDQGAWSNTTALPRIGFPQKGLTILGVVVSVEQNTA